MRASTGKLALVFVLTSILGLVSCGETEPENAYLKNTDRFFVIRATETTHEYVPGQKTKVWAYNGQVPGPALHANVGEVVTIRFINNLPEPATLHWHGLELPANMDGSHISQKLVPPGGEFIYRFKVLRAATYWYHSHVMPFKHVEMGLQAPFVVHDPKENERLNLPRGDKVLMLDDVLLDDNYQVKKPIPDDPLKRAMTLTNGRMGNHLIVNGKKLPLTKVKAGVPVRLRFVNSSNSRFYRLSWPGQKLYRIGGDTGLLPEPVEILPVETIDDPKKPIRISNPDPSQGLLLTPGERAEVYWVPQGQNEFVPLEWHDFPRGQHAAHYDPKNGFEVDLLPDGEDGKKPKKIVAEFFIEGDKKAQDLAPPSELRPSELLTHHDLTSHDPLMIMFGHSPADPQGNVMFFATALHNKDGSMKPIPFMKLTNETALNAELNEVRMFEVVNMSRGIHPFHLHGFPFQWLETEYQDEDNPENNYTIKNHKPWSEWKDTIPVPGRLGFRGKSRTIMRLLVRFDDVGRAGTVVAHGRHPEGERSGGWMTHCHILEHAGKGMATWLNLWDEGKNPYKGGGGHDHGHHHHHKKKKGHSGHH